MEIRKFAVTDEAAVIQLWERCELTRPWNDPRKDIRRKLAVRPDLFLVGVVGGEVVGSVMAEAERLLHREGCPKINLQVRATNEAVIAFYQRLGYADDEVVSFGKRLVRDDPQTAEPGAAADSGA